MQVWATPETYTVIYNLPNIFINIFVLIYCFCLLFFNVNDQNDISSLNIASYMLDGLPWLQTWLKLLCFQVDIFTFTKLFPFII